MMLSSYWSNLRVHVNDKSYVNVLKMINPANNEAHAKVIMTLKLLFMFEIMLVNDLNWSKLPWKFSFSSALANFCKLLYLSLEVILIFFPFIFLGEFSKSFHKLNTKKLQSTRRGILHPNHTYGCKHNLKVSFMLLSVIPPDRNFIIPFHALAVVKEIKIILSTTIWSSKDFVQEKRSSLHYKSYVDVFSPYFNFKLNLE